MSAVGPIPIRITETGSKEVLQHFADMQRNFTSNSIGQLVEIALQLVQDEAQARAPVFTGALRDSIQHQMISPSAGECFVGVDYGAAQEWGYMTAGGKRVPGKNYFKPAAIHGRQELLKMLQDYLRGNTTPQGAKQIATGGFKGARGRSANVHKYQYKRVNAQGKTTYYYGKKSTTVTRRKALLYPNKGKQYKQTGKRRNIGRKTR